MIHIQMAAQTKSMSWSGKDDGAFWGLTRFVGPWTPTAADRSRSFRPAQYGEHAGHGNWWQSFNPHPYIQTKHQPGNSYFYGSDSLDVVTPEHYVKPRGGQRIPKSRGSAGGLGIPGMLVVDGETGVGPERDKQTEDQKRGYGVATADTETVVKFNVDRAMPPRVMNVPRQVASYDKFKLEGLKGLPQGDTPMYPAGQSFYNPNAGFKAHLTADYNFKKAKREALKRTGATEAAAYKVQLMDHSMEDREAHRTFSEGLEDKENVRPKKIRTKTGEDIDYNVNEYKERLRGYDVLSKKAQEATGKSKKRFEELRKNTLENLNSRKFYAHF